MNLGLRTLLFIAAIVCFIIAIFSDVHWPDWIAIGLILFILAVFDEDDYANLLAWGLGCVAAALLLTDIGWDRKLGGPRRGT